MNYFLDTEFDGFFGPLVSMALVREDGLSLYCTTPHVCTDPWVVENVVPILWSLPDIGIRYRLPEARASTITHAIRDMLRQDDGLPNIVTDWPTDIVHFCNLIQLAPGRMMESGDISFLLARVDAYPTELENAVQHNAYWDAMALRHYFKEEG